MTKLSGIVERHVTACVKELRAAVEAEFAAAGRAMAPGAPVVRAKRGGGGRAATPRDRRGKSKPTRSSKARVVAKPPQPVKPPPAPKPHTCSAVDAERAARFAKLEAATAKRNGAAA